MAVYMITPYTGAIPTAQVKKGSKGENVKRVQTFLNWSIKAKLTVDGVCGTNTVKAIKKWQGRYGLRKDGVFGSESRAMAKYLVKMQPWIKALYDQYIWSKNQKYDFDDHPTIANSKKRGTCITGPNVALQRLGIMPSGDYVYYNPSKNRLWGSGKNYVLKHKDIYGYSYPHKTIKQLIEEGKIKPFDIVCYDDPKYHTQVWAGLNAKGEPIFISMGSTKKYGKTYSYYADRKVDMIIRIKKI